MTKEDNLMAAINNTTIDKLKVIEALKGGWKATGFWNIEEMKGVYDLYVNNNLNGAKQHFFSCGILDEFEISKLNSPILDYGLNHLSYALLSDNKPLIDRYANLTHSYYNKSIANGGATATYVVQCIIKDDWVEYERAMAIMHTKTLKKYPAMKWDTQLFEAIAERNTLKIEETLATFVTPKIHMQRNRLHTLLNGFISHPALGYAKLVWLKGLQVEVDSPLIPKDLLPIKPLEHYVNEYAFLDDVEIAK